MTKQLSEAALTHYREIVKPELKVCFSHDKAVVNMVIL